MMPLVSVTLSVVCVTKWSPSGSGISTDSASATLPTSLITPFSDEYCPSVPSTSGCPAWPIMMTLSPFLEQALTSAWTRVTSGQVASNTRSGLDFASFLTLSGTPCAEKMRTLPSGTSESSSMKTAPRSRSPSTTKRLCTTSCLT